MINGFETVDGLISALGGAKQVAQIAGVGVTAVCNWRRSNRIPPHLYLSFKQACDDRDVQIPEKLFARAVGSDRFQPGPADPSRKEGVGGFRATRASE